MFFVGFIKYKNNGRVGWYFYKQKTLYLKLLFLIIIFIMYLWYVNVEEFKIQQVKNTS